MSSTKTYVGARPDRYATRHMTAAECDEAVFLYLEHGMTRLALADRYFRETSTIDRLLKRRGALRNMLTSNKDGVS